MPPKASSQPIVALALAAGLAVLPTSKAFAASDRLIEYMNVTPLENGGFAISQGDRAISSDQFVAALERLKAAPDFTLGLHQAQAAQTGLTWSTVGLVALLPVLGTVYFINNQRNPTGVYTRSWGIATLVDAAAATGLGIWTLFRSAQPRFNQEQAENAAQAYNRTLDGLESRGARP